MTNPLSTTLIAETLVELSKQPEPTNTAIPVRPRDMIDMHDAAVRHGDTLLAEGLEQRFPELFRLAA